MGTYINPGNDGFKEIVKGGFVDKTGFDIQKVDIGIAMSHFIYGLEEQGRKAEILLSDPGIAAPQEVFYIATFRLE